MGYTPTTELEAVNMMLKYIGEQPVNSIPLSGLNEATIAQSTLLETSREVQSWGLDCNTESSYVLAQDVSGNVTIPSNALNVDPVDTGSNYVVRGTRLYDKDNHTYTIGEDVEVDITFLLPFDQLPEVVRHYITIKAVRKYIVQMLGAEDLYKLTQLDEQMALVNLKRHELLSYDTGMLNSTTARSITQRSV